MEEAILKQLLVQTEEQIATAQQHIVRQHRLVAHLKLKATMRDMTQAEQMLATFEQSLENSLEDRDRICRLLKEK
jgi:hypothetical protein